MDKSLVIENLKKSYQEFIALVESLSPKQFETSVNEKWSPGQELEHILMSTAPIAKALPNKDFLKTQFGSLDHEPITYYELVDWYQITLEKGGKATKAFSPSIVIFDKKESLCKSIEQTISAISTTTNDYTEEELDTIVIPHPLLGKLSVREMLYFSTYHVKHHQKSIENKLV